MRQFADHRKETDHKQVIKLKGDQELIMQCQKGDKEAFFLLVKPQLQRSYSTALSILRSTHSADEAVQNVLLEAYSEIMREKPIRNFKSWFSHLVACRTLDLARQHSKSNNKFEDVDQENILNEQDSPAEIDFEKKRGHELFRAVMSLDMNLRSIIVLFYYQELSTEEIAQLLKLNNNTVISRLHDARLKLIQIVPSGIREQMIEC